MKKRDDIKSISVIGCGRWGTFIAWYGNRIGHKVKLYGRVDSLNMRNLIDTRKKDSIYLDESIRLETNLEETLKSDIIIISISSQNLRALMSEISKYNVKEKIFVLCMKGIEVSTNKRLTEVMNEFIDDTNEVAIWVGPGHTEEFYKGNPNCMVIDSNDYTVTKKLVEYFSSDLIRLYLGNDLIGNEIGAATKNVIGIGAGMLDGLNKSYLKGALMSRACSEISKLIAAMGGNAKSAYGLAHLGDYEATLFSEHSHNRRFGEYFATNMHYDKLAEGYYTIKPLVDLGEKYNVKLPICNAIYEILYDGKDATIKLEELFYRKIKNEIND